MNHLISICARGAAAALLTLPLLAGPPAAPPVEWLSSYEAAQAAAKQTGKPILAAFR
jgi:hypothetical protein